MSKNCLHAMWDRFIYLLWVLLASTGCVMWLFAPNDHAMLESSHGEERVHSGLEVEDRVLSAPMKIHTDPTGLGESVALDRDGLSDTDKVVRYGTALARFDGDGVAILQIGANLLNADSDGDGLEDGEEVQFYATDPLVADNDGDVFADGKEIVWSIDPLVATSAGGDPDDDGGTSIDAEDSEPAPVPTPSAAGTTVLGVQSSQFTLNGVPTFLYGITYASGLGAPQAFIEQDLDEMQRFGINWLRVWATRNRFDHDASIIDDSGRLRPTFMAKLKWLVIECARRGMVVDITLSLRDKPILDDLKIHRRTVETLVIELRDYRNWYLDMANEANGDVGFGDLRHLRDAVKRLDPKRLVTASHSFEISPGDLAQYLFTVKVDFITPHHRRDPETHRETTTATRRYLEQMSVLGREVPVHYQEPFRRGYNRWQPEAVDFVNDLRLSWQGGAAGWSFHNGDQRHPLPAPPGRHPRRSADLRTQRLFKQLDTVERQALEKLQDFAESRIFHD